MVLLQFISSNIAVEVSFLKVVFLSRLSFDVIDQSYFFLGALAIYQTVLFPYFVFL